MPNRKLCGHESASPYACQLQDASAGEVWPSMGWRIIHSYRSGIRVTGACRAQVSGGNGLLSDVGLGPESLGVVVNDDDPVSIRVAAYYKTIRRIPEGQHNTCAIQVRRFNHEPCGIPEDKGHG